MSACCRGNRFSAKYSSKSNELFNVKGEMVAASRVPFYTGSQGTVQSYNAEFTQVTLYITVHYILPIAVMGQET